MYCQSFLQQAGENFNLTLYERDKVLPTVFFGRLLSFHFFALFSFFFIFFAFLMLFSGIPAESEDMKKIFVRR